MIGIIKHGRLNQLQGERKENIAEPTYLLAVDIAGIISLDVSSQVVHNETWLIPNIEHTMDRIYCRAHPGKIGGTYRKSTEDIRALSQYKDCLSWYGISIIKIWQSWKHIFFIMWILKLVRWYLYIEMAPWYLSWFHSYTKWNEDSLTKTTFFSKVKTEFDPEPVNVNWYVCTEK